MRLGGGGVGTELARAVAEGDGDAVGASSLGAIASGRGDAVARAVGGAADGISAIVGAVVGADGSPLGVHAPATSASPSNTVVTTR